MTQTQQVFSPSQWAVQKAEEYFSIKEDEGKVKTGLKVAGRALTDTALTVAAIAETVVFAVLTAITFATSYLKDQPYASLKERTMVAANTVKDAAKGIVGYNSVEAEEEAEAPAPAFFSHPIAWAQYKLGY